MQFWVWLTFTVLLELVPLPEIITTVPLPEDDGLGEDEGVGVFDGEGLGFGVVEGFGVGVGEGEFEGDGLGEREGLGKLAAAVKELERFPALLEKSPKTELFKAKSIKKIRKENKKYSFLITTLFAFVLKFSFLFVFQFLFLYSKVQGLQKLVLDQQLGLGIQGESLGSYLLCQLPAY